MNTAKMKIILLLCILGVVLLLSSCTTSESTTGNIVTTTNNAATTGPVKDVTISMFNYGFNQDSTTIHQGDHVRLHIKSTQGTHGFKIPDLGLSTDELDSGEEQVLEFEANQSGTFSYYCNVPCGSGHRSMRGQLVVE